MLVMRRFNQCPDTLIFVILQKTRRLQTDIANLNADKKLARYGKEAKSQPQFKDIQADTEDKNVMFPTR